MKEWNPYDEIKKTVLDNIMQNVFYGNPETEPGENESSTNRLIAMFIE